MIDRIIVTNNISQLELSLLEPQPSGLLILNIDGLDPPKANINSTDIVGFDGTRVNSIKAESRNIVLSLLLLDPIQDNKEKIYNIFRVKSNIHLEFITDSRDVFIDGYVESVSMPQFTSQMSVQISIVCNNPWFYTEDQETLLYGIEGGFEFPFSIENPMSFSELINVEERSILYSGSEETGCIVKLHFIGEISATLDIFNNTSGDLISLSDTKIELITGNPIQNGDDITINCYRGRKSIILTRNGVDWNIINAMRIDSKWLRIIPGDNICGFNNNTPENIQMSVLHNMLYGGI